MEKNKQLTENIEKAEYHIQVKEDEISQLKNQLQLTINELDALKVSYENSTTSLIATQEELDTTRTRLSSQTDQRQSLQDQLTQLKQSLTAEQSQFDSERSRYNI